MTVMENVGQGTTFQPTVCSAPLASPNRIQFEKMFFTNSFFWGRNQPITLAYWESRNYFNIKKNKKIKPPLNTSLFYIHIKKERSQEERKKQREICGWAEGHMKRDCCFNLRHWPLTWGQDLSSCWLTVKHPIRLCSKGRWKARGSPHQSSSSVAAVWKLAGFCKCWLKRRNQIAHG